MVPRTQIAESAPPRSPKGNPTTLRSCAVSSSTSASSCGSEYGRSVVGKSGIDERVASSRAIATTSARLPRCGWTSHLALSAESKSSMTSSRTPTSAMPSPPAPSTENGTLIFSRRGRAGSPRYLSVHRWRPVTTCPLVTRNISSWCSRMKPVPAMMQTSRSGGPGIVRSLLMCTDMNEGSAISQSCMIPPERRKPADPGTLLGRPTNKHLRSSKLGDQNNRTRPRTGRVRVVYSESRGWVYADQDLAAQTRKGEGTCSKQVPSLFFGRSAISIANSPMSG